MLPLLDRYQSDEQAKKDNAAKVIQKKYIDARGWLPGQQRIAAAYVPPSRLNAVYRGGPAYEAFKGKYAPVGKIKSIQGRKIPRGGKRTTRKDKKKHRRRKSTRKQKKRRRTIKR